MSILREDSLNRVQSLLPVSIDHMKFTFLQKRGKEVFVLNRDLCKSLEGLIVLLLFFKKSGFSKHRFQMFWLTQLSTF
jgi:hypothetical protein